MTTKPYTSVSVAAPNVPMIKRRYSVTTDVVAYRRCAKQYGAFGVYDYAPAEQTQLYFGTIIHQVLDRCHSHYKGLLDPSLAGTLPDDGQVLRDLVVQQYFDEVRTSQQSGQPIPPAPSDLLRYFIEVENGLRSRGIRAITPDLRIKAIRLLQYFNALEGPQLYPRVLDTEYRLQADQGTHILHGVVDLLVGTSSQSSDPADCEIWDYKGTNRISVTTRDLETYRFQMQVYANLYERKNGVLPRRVNLYFVNELDGPTPPSRRPKNAILQVNLDPVEIEQAIDEFRRTVQDIEQSRKLDSWPAASVGAVSAADCTICDLRWNCRTPNGGKGVAMRYP